MKCAVVCCVLAMEQAVNQTMLSRTVAVLPSARTDSDETEDETTSQQNDVIWMPASAVAGPARPSTANLRQQDAVVYVQSAGIGVISSSSSTSGTSSASSSGEDTSWMLDPRRHGSNLSQHDTPAITHTLGIVSQRRRRHRRIGDGMAGGVAPPSPPPPLSKKQNFGKNNFRANIM